MYEALKVAAHTKLFVSVGDKSRRSGIGSNRRFAKSSAKAKANNVHKRR
jgi:hypothetical protein